MTGPAALPRPPPERSRRADAPPPGRALGGAARIVVGNRAFYVVPASTRDASGPDAESVSGEQARFDLCGRTFLVLEDCAADAAPADDVTVRLTERELQIAVLVALGNPTKRIAFKLGITEWTVKEHLRRIFAKLRVRSQAAMIFRCGDLLQRLHREGRLTDPAHAGGRAADLPGRATVMGTSRSDAWL